ncbi:MAG: hypothetical protein RL662_348 [Bacteroidota bacterium]|jgi:glyoxylase-like metal-dependent hydrolase (beta-lactamase superfamily II)
MNRNQEKQAFRHVGYQQFRIGEIEAIILSDGYLKALEVQPGMAPEANMHEISDILRNSYLSDQGYELAMNILLLKKDDRIILFDTGTGTSNLIVSTAGCILTSLEEVGISPDQITDIVLSHGHFDHIGGLVNNEGKSNYPNANIYISEIEYESWTSKNPDFSKSKWLNKVETEGMSRYLKGILEIIKPQVILLTDGETILDCITIKITSGHSEGHIITEITSQGQSLFCIGDVVHYDALLLPRPEWGTMYDWDFDLAIKTRIEILETLSSKASLVFGYHFPYPGIGYIRKTGETSYQWFAKQFYSPKMG